MSSPQQPWSQPPSSPQPYAPQQPVPQPGPQAFDGPSGELVLNLQRPFGAMGMISPVVTIDGYPATASWGRNSFRAPAGVRQVSVAQTYLWTYGQASMPVTVEPGRTSEINYAGPMWTFGMGGAIGVGPQKRPGTTLFLVLMAVVVLVILLAVVAGALGSS